MRMPQVNPEDSCDFWRIAFRRSVVRAGRVAAVVGVVLATINHGDFIVSGELTLVTFLKITASFCVPYCVSTYSSVLAVREQNSRHLTEQ